MDRYKKSKRLNTKITSIVIAEAIKLMIQIRISSIPFIRVDLEETQTKCQSIIFFIILTLLR